MKKRSLVNTNLIVKYCGNVLPENETGGNDILKKLVTSSPAQQIQSFLNYIIYDEKQKDVFEFFLNLPPLQSLILCGSPGSGKDDLVMCYLRSQIEKGIITRFFNNTLGALIRLFRDLSYKFGLPETEAFEMLCDFDYLVIRDIGAYTTTEKGFDFFNELVDYFVENNKPLILTTNLLPSQLKSAVGERVVDRLHSVVIKFQGKKVISCNWPSFRKENMQKDMELNRLFNILPLNRLNEGKIRQIQFCDVCNTYFESGDWCKCDFEKIDDLSSFHREHFRDFFISENIKVEDYKNLVLDSVILEAVFVKKL